MINKNESRHRKGNLLITKLPRLPLISVALSDTCGAISFDWSEPSTATVRGTVKNECKQERITALNGRHDRGARRSVKRQKDERCGTSCVGAALFIRIFRNSRPFRRPIITRRRSEQRNPPFLFFHRTPSGLTAFRKSGPLGSLLYRVFTGFRRT